MTTTESTPTTTTAEPGTGERADLLATLRMHRTLLLRTAQGLDEEQARVRTTVSELCLGGLVKHVTFGERQWTDFIVRGAAAMGGEDGVSEWAAGFVMTPDETLADVVSAYEAVARRTDELVVALPDLDASHALPEAPWFAPGARWSARRVLLHVVAETAQHAGHADIIRETLDGQKSMG